MKKTLLLCSAALFSFSSLIAQEETAVKDYPISPVPFSEVDILDQFWSRKIKINHDVTIPIAIEQSEITGRIDNFKKAAGAMDGPFGSEYPFDDSDVYKILEAASYSLQTNPDPHLEQQIDDLIRIVAAAQEPDGYLFTSRSIKEGKMHPWNGNERWVNVNELSHELYNMGHLFEAAAAHYTATGKETLLNVALKSADLIVNTFGPDKVQNYPGHQEIEIGFVKLYRITGKQEYLEMAKYFLDVRGKEGIGRQDPYNQSHVPVIEQTTAVGHSVRAAYMWTSMADVAAITGNEDYVNAINILWEDVTNKQYYINGGIGSTGSHEGFGGSYVLPNMSAYNETCAGVGNSAWNHRMFLMTGNSKFIDILERTMYNNVLSGVSYTGDRFFYPNPLASKGQHERSEWFGCACCPPNVARFLPSMPGYIYAQKDNEIFVNLFISSKTDFKLPAGNITVEQKSEMPWTGDVRLSIETEYPVSADLKLRIPGWARNKPVPGDLYTYKNTVKDGIKVSLNGKNHDATIDDMGYININREWKTGDNIDISLPFEVRVVKAHDEVAEDRGKIAIERGPIVYAAEWADNDGSVLNMVVDENPVFTASKDSELFGGIITLEGKGRFAKKMLDGTVELSDEKTIKLIPYHLWNNRGPGEMRVWLPTSTETTKPLPAPTIAARSKITASRDSRSLFSVADQEEPASSGSHATPYFHWWPKKGTWEWVQFEVDKTEQISSVSVYWFDDSPNGGTRVPTEWEVVYKKPGSSADDDSNWIPVKSKNGYTVTKDAWDKVEFKAVKTDLIRVRVRLSDTHAAGIHEIVINN